MAAWPRMCNTVQMLDTAAPLVVGWINILSSTWQYGLVIWPSTLGLVVVFIVGLLTVILATTIICSLKHVKEALSISTEHELIKYPCL